MNAEDIKARQATKLANAQAALAALPREQRLAHFKGTCLGMIAPQPSFGKHGMSDYDAMQKQQEAWGASHPELMSVCEQMVEYKKLVQDAQTHIQKAAEEADKLIRRDNYAKKKAADAAKELAQMKADKIAAEAKAAAAKKAEEEKARIAAKNAGLSGSAPTQKDCDDLTTHFDDEAYMEKHMDLAEVCGYALL